MKVVEKYLYSRLGHFYYRSSLPVALHHILPIKEITIALASQDLGESRMLAAQLNFEKTKLLKAFQDNLRKPSADRPIEDSIADFIEGINKLKNLVGYEAPINYSDIKSSRKGEATPLFSNIYKKYMLDYTHNAPRTKAIKIRVYELFIELVGDLPLNKIAVNEAREFKSYLQKIPANARKKYKVGNLRDIKWDEVNEAGQHQMTINNNLSFLVSLFNWAIRNSLYAGTNPFSNLIVRGHKNLSTKYSPFGPDEIRALFYSPIFKGNKGKQWGERLQTGNNLTKDSLYWVPLIGLYSGMRMNEICQLDITDIRQENGIYYFDVNEDSQEKALKTSSSKRKVPIHEKLISLGLLEYAIDLKSKRETRLFPDIEKRENLNFSYLFSKRFRRLLDALGLKRKGLCFHSFRHTFIDGMRNAEIDRAVVMTLVGHQSSKDVHGGYGNGYNLAILQRSINKLSFLCMEP